MFCRRDNPHFSSAYVRRCSEKINHENPVDLIESGEKIKKSISEKPNVKDAMGYYVQTCDAQLKAIIRKDTPSTGEIICSYLFPPGSDYFLRKRVEDIKARLDDLLKKLKKIAFKNEKLKESRASVEDSYKKIFLAIKENSFQNFKRDCKDYERAKFGFLYLSNSLELSDSDKCNVQKIKEIFGDFYGILRDDFKSRMKISLVNDFVSIEDNYLFFLGYVVIICRNNLIKKFKNRILYEKSYENLEKLIEYNKALSEYKDELNNYSYAIDEFTQYSREIELNMSKNDHEIVKNFEKHVLDFYGIFNEDLNKFDIKKHKDNLRQDYGNELLYHYKKMVQFYSTVIQSKEYLNYLKMKREEKERAKGIEIIWTDETEKELVAHDDGPDPRAEFLELVLKGLSASQVPEYGQFKLSVKYFRNNFKQNDSAEFYNTIVDAVEVFATPKYQDAYNFIRVMSSLFYVIHPKLPPGREHLIPA